MRSGSFLWMLHKRDITLSLSTLDLLFYRFKSNFCFDCKVCLSFFLHIKIHLHWYFDGCNALVSIRWSCDLSPLSLQVGLIGSQQMWVCAGPALRPVTFWAPLGPAGRFLLSGHAVLECLYGGQQRFLHHVLHDADDQIYVATICVCECVQPDGSCSEWLCFRWDGLTDDTRDRWRDSNLQGQGHTVRTHQLHSHTLNLVVCCDWSIQWNPEK